MDLPHRLLSTRRMVAARDRHAYWEAWTHLRRSAEAAGAHAWVFRSEADPVEILEFVEWSLGDPEGDAAFRDALAALDSRCPGSRERWVEATEPMEGS